MDGSTLDKYVDPMPNFANNRVDGTHHLTVTMKEFQQHVLPSTYTYPAGFENGTYVWGYEVKDDVTGVVYGPLYPAWTIDAQRGIPTHIKYVNELGTSTTPPVLRDYIYVDQTIHWANPLNVPMGDPSRMENYTGPQPAVVHLHGAEVPSAFDGGPDAWVTPGPPGTRIEGPGFVTDEYIYPNTQEPCNMWYHDHTLGATRLNVYAGLAGFYLLRDHATENATLPSGDQEIEIVVQDRMFDVNGQLYFPNTGVNINHPTWMPEFFGDVMLANGKPWPYLNVQPRRYRFHFLDGCNARFLNMWLQNPSTGTVGPLLYQIGSDGGYLNAPAALQKLFVAPGERADVIIDFSKVPLGSSVVLYNDAAAPYPTGDPVDPNTTGQIMKFNVVLPLTGTDNSYNPARPLTALRPAPVSNLNPAVTRVQPNIKRQLVLKESENLISGNPDEVLVNNTKFDGLNESTMMPVAGSQLIGSNYITELPQVGATEVWQIINLTVDAHPIHIHLIQFQVISRQAYSPAYLDLWNSSFPGGSFIPGYGPPFNYTTPNSDGAIGGNPAISRYLSGPPMVPAVNERGWKDTFKAFPGEVATVVARFAPQGEPVSSTLAGKNKFAFDPTVSLGQTDAFGYPGGEGYVWHCHIIDHEDNEMMRPFMVMNTPQIGMPKQGEGQFASNLPASFSLSQNYPNPFNPATKISFSIPENSFVTMKLYNVIGQEVASLVNTNLTQGEHVVLFNASNLPSGIYMYKLTAGANVSTRKMLLLK